MIVGTAGHIDHGKTALVRALTGIATDRLPEEQRRGITIELGYAFLPQDAGPPIGFIDVPGHEKLVHTMVAGATGIDYALLLVAADDGVMPQTVEHLTILGLLGITRGAAVVTKADCVDAATLEERRTQVRALLDDAQRADWPVHAVSALRGDGVGALAALLREEAARPGARQAAHAGFRMPLDRVFSLAGVGTVVAGSIAAGTVRVGDALCLAHAPDHLLRVRSLQSHGSEVTQAQAGQRCAIGLAGLAREDVRRGQVLCTPAIAQAGVRLDAWLQVAATEDGPLRSGTLVHLHVGTQDVMATVAVLGANGIAPGGEGLVQLVLREPVHAWQADRFVLRDASARRTVAGGEVLDPQGPARYRQAPERLALLEAQHAGTPQARFAAALAHAPWGLQEEEWLRAAGQVQWPFALSDLPEAVRAEGAGWIVARPQLESAEQAVLEGLRDFHAAWPQEVGPDAKRMRRVAAPRMPDAQWERLVARLVASGRVAFRNGFLQLPEHGEQLRSADRVVAERALPLLAAGRFDPPWVRDIAADTHLPELQVRQTLARLTQSGDAFQVVKDLYYPPRTVRELAEIARAISAREGCVEAGSFRDATGLGRKRAIQILEFFDRVGLLRRVGDQHLLRPGTQLFSEQEVR
jgi:selenocysteine-specific elongation factor